MYIFIYITICFTYTHITININIGHSFCSICTEKLRLSSNRCPICNVEIIMTLTNYSLLDTIDSISLSKSIIPSSPAYDSHLTVHHNHDYNISTREEEGGGERYGS